MKSFVLYSKQRKNPHILKTDENLPFARFVRVKQIKPHMGGNVWVGDPFCGISDAEILPDTVAENTDVRFYWKTHGLLMGKIEVSTEVKNPIKVRFSYKDANLNGIDEGRIRIYKFDQNENRWKLVGGKVDRIRKRVAGWIDAGSSFALGTDMN